MNIKPIRKARRMSQQQLADRLNISRTSLTMWEIGKATPTVDHLVAMADILGCTTDELIGRSAPQSCNSKGPSRVELRLDAETFSRVVCKAIHDSLEASRGIVGQIEKNFQDNKRRVTVVWEGQRKIEADKEACSPSNPSDHPQEEVRGRDRCF